MIIETKKAMDQHKKIIDGRIDDWDVIMNRSEIDIDSRLKDFNKVAERIQKENLRNEKFKGRIEEEMDGVSKLSKNLEKEIKELVNVVKLLDNERIEDGKNHDVLQGKMDVLSKDVESVLKKAQEISKNNEEMQEEFIKNVVINFDDFKQASVEDFNTLNKRINLIIPALDQITDLEHDVELLKKKGNKQFRYDKKDIRSPLMSVMQGIEIDQKRLQRSGSKSRSRSKGRLTRQRLRGQIRSLSDEESPDSYHPSRDNSPIDQIMRKDKHSKKKLEILRKSELKVASSVRSGYYSKRHQPRTEIESDNDSNVTFQKGKSGRKDDLEVQEFSDPDDSIHERRRGFKNSGRNKQPNKGKFI